MTQLSFEVLRAKDHRRMPWKNGGGETVEIAVVPKSAGLGEFDWRISMATVASDGPFSIFPNIDRTLSILDGAGMVLAIEGREPVCLTQDSEPLPFPADASTTATLIDGTITDLNVMTRRDTYRHAVTRAEAGDHQTFDLTADTTLILCDGTSLNVRVGIAGHSLAASDCAIINCGRGQKVTLSGEGHYFVIGLQRV